MEKMQDAGQDSMEIIENDVRLFFDEYCQVYNIDDMRKEKQTVFDGAMTYIYRHYFKNTGKLKCDPYSIVDNSINNIMTNFNAYDVNRLYELYLYIQELANAHDKIASIAVFKKLTGISKQTLSVWRNKSSASSLDSDKKAFLNWLTDNNEDELKEFNLRNPLGPQEQLNVDHGRREIKTTMRIETDTGTRTPKQIQEQYGMQLEYKGEMPELPE